MRTWQPSDLPRVLSTARAASLGVSRAQRRTELARGHWRVLARGVLLTRPDEPSRLDWAVAGVILAGADSGVTGWDAVRLHGFGDREPPTPFVYVTVRHGRPRDVGQVRIRPTTRPFSLAMVPVQDPDLGGLTYVRTARAVVDTALVEADPSRVRALVTGAIQKRRCTVRDLVDEAAAAPRRNGALLRAALADVIDGARSAAEALALRKLKAARLPDFELNVSIVVGGQVIFVVDILFRALRLVIEIDSREFHFSEAGWLATLARHSELTALGFAVHHHAPSAVRQRDWIALVERLVRARAAELGVPYRTGGLVAPPPGSDPPPYVFRL